MFKNQWLRRVAVCLMVLGLGVGSAYAMSGTTYGNVVLHNGQIAPKGEVTYVAFINGKDEVIHTENAFNSALGAGNGYMTKDNKGMWLVNFANFSEGKPGDTFNIVFTSKDGKLRGSYDGEVPGGLTPISEDVTMKPVAMPLPVAGFAAQRSDNGVVLSWNSTEGLKYRIYRADLPSGADNANSRGIYDKVAEGVTGNSFVDENTNSGAPHWYLILAEDKNGVLSGHSGEVRVNPVNVSGDQLQRVSEDLLQGKDAVKTGGSSDR